MINTLKYVIISTEHKLLLSKYNACVHHVPFFSDTSTWYHKVHSKYVGKCLFCNNICYAKDIAFLISQYTICAYHNYHEILYLDISSIVIIVASLVPRLSHTARPFHCRAIVD